MCISARASINSFAFNIIGAILLVVFGNKEIKLYNIITAVFFAFVGLMQVVDFGMWIDLGCSLGTNKLASILGPFLNFLQPVAIFLILLFMLKKTKIGKQLYDDKITKLEEKYPIFRQFSIANTKRLNIIHVLNIIYVIAIIILLTNFFVRASKDSTILCTKVVNGKLAWPWAHQQYKTLIVYGLWQVTLLNILSINPKSIYVITVILLSWGFLFISSLLSSNNTPEVWCYVVNSIPLIMLVLQKVFPKKMRSDIESVDEKKLKKNKNKV
jgi:hypothetical protein